MTDTHGKYVLDMITRKGYPRFDVYNMSDKELANFVYKYFTNEGVDWYKRELMSEVYTMNSKDWNKYTRDVVQMIIRSADPRYLKKEAFSSLTDKQPPSDVVRRAAEKELEAAMFKHAELLTEWRAMMKKNIGAIPNLETDEIIEMTRKIQEYNARLEKYGPMNA